MLVVFGIKAAIFPLFFWLPDSYPTAPSPVTAIFAGLLTKVGVYAIIRTQTLLFPADTRPGTLLLWLAGATMLVGVLGAIAQGDVKRILSFQIVSHIGYMIMGLGLFTVAGLAAAVLYTIHHIVAKTGLFLTGGLIEHAGGSSRLTRLGGMVRTGACDRRAVPGARAQPDRPAPVLGVRGQVRAGGRRLRQRSPYAVMGGGAGGEPAHHVLADEDLDLGVLEPGDRAAARRRPTRPAAPSRWAVRC